MWGVRLSSYHLYFVDDFSDAINNVFVNFTSVVIGVILTEIGGFFGLSAPLRILFCTARKWVDWQNSQDLTLPFSCWYSDAFFYSFILTRFGFSHFLSSALILVRSSIPAFVHGFFNDMGMSYIRWKRKLIILLLWSHCGWSVVPESFETIRKWLFLASKASRKTLKRKLSLFFVKFFALSVFVVSRHVFVLPCARIAKRRCRSFTHVLVTPDVRPLKKKANTKGTLKMIEEWRTFITFAVNRILS